MKIKAVFSMIVTMVIPCVCMTMDAMRFKLIKLENKTDYTITLNNVEHNVLAELKPYQTQKLQQYIELQSCSPVWKFAEINIVAHNDQEHVNRVLRLGHGLSAFSDLQHSYIAIEKPIPVVKKIIEARGKVLASWGKNYNASLHPRKYLITLIFAGQRLNDSKLEITEVFDKFEDSKSDTSQGFWH